MRPLLDYVIGFLNGESKENFLEVLKVYCKRGDRSGVIRLLVMIAGKDPRSKLSPGQCPWEGIDDCMYYLLAQLVINKECSLSEALILSEFVNKKGRVYSEMPEDLRRFWRSNMGSCSILSLDCLVFTEFLEAYRNDYIYNKEICEDRVRRSRERREAEKKDFI
jgi:hypothetical protein